MNTSSRIALPLLPRPEEIQALFNHCSDKDHRYTTKINDSKTFFDTNVQATESLYHLYLSIHNGLLKTKYDEFFRQESFILKIRLYPDGINEIESNDPKELVGFRGCTIELDVDIPLYDRENNRVHVADDILKNIVENFGGYTITQDNMEYYNGNDETKEYMLKKQIKLLSTSLFSEFKSRYKKIFSSDKIEDIKIECHNIAVESLNELDSKLRLDCYDFQPKNKSISFDM